MFVSGIGRTERVKIATSALTGATAFTQRLTWDYNPSGTIRAGAALNGADTGRERSCPF
jgi:hypothetical protein